MARARQSEPCRRKRRAPASSPMSSATSARSSRRSAAAVSSATVGSASTTASLPLRAQLALEDLPAGVAGQRVDEGDGLRHLELRQLAAAVLDELLLGGRRAWLQHD